MGAVAVIVVDMLNPYDHEDADELQKSVEQIMEPLAGLTRRAHRHRDARLIVVNDNHGDFTATREDLQRRALEGRRPDLVEASLRMMERNMRADLLPADHCLG